MNFLAHCALATDAADAWHVQPAAADGLLAGAVIGDFVKGRINSAWPAALQAGVCLHRKVDAVSNQHAGIKTCSRRFPAELRRLAPIFVDILADYHLTLRWHDYYAEPLTDFSRRCYASLQRHQPYMTANAKRFLDYMLETDLLSRYDNWENVERGLRSVLRRLGRQAMQQEVSRACSALREDSGADFAAFYPDLRTRWQGWNAFDVIAAPQN